MPVSIRSVDAAAFYQLKSMLQGVVARGTARAISRLSSYVAGKTGTSDDENDAWFIGLTNDVTVAVWLGYDNAPGGKRRTLGSGSTGGAVAVPVFEPIIEAVWSNVASKRALAPPSPQAKKELACSGTSEEPREGRRRSKASPGAITECFRVDGRGQVIDTKYRLVAQGSVPAREEMPRSDRPAYAFDAQGRWPFAAPWPGASQWRPRYGFEWRSHRPRSHWRRY
jgi:membrane carboxypeptidase/penicillin-binding protein